MAVRVLLILVTAVFAALSSASSVSAHTLATDGRISAFLHIAPDDVPRPGKTNTVHFYFNDQDFRFSLEGCDCSAQVKQGKDTLYKGGLAAEARRVGRINVFLPLNNFSYDVIVKGTPKTAGFFQPFTLKFDIDVGHPPPAPPPAKHRISWLLVPVVLAAAGYWLFRQRHSRLIMKR